MQWIAQRVIVLFMLAGGVSILSPTIGNAGDYPAWIDRTVDQPRNSMRGHERRRHRPHIRPAKHIPTVTGPAGEPDKACKPVVRVVGDQRPTEDGAKEQADKAWMQEVRFRYGERYMQTTTARELRYACSRASIAEIIGNPMQRCEIIALPCPAEVIWRGAK